MEAMAIQLMAMLTRQIMAQRSVLSDVKTTSVKQHVSQDVASRAHAPQERLRRIRSLQREPQLGAGAGAEVQEIQQ